MQLNKSRTQRGDLSHQGGVPTILFQCMMLLLLAVACCLSAEVFCRHVLHMTDLMYTWPLRVESVRFPDLVSFHSRFQYLHTELFFTWTGTTPFLYPATAAVLLCGFYAFSPHIVAAYLVFSFTVLGIGAVLFTRALVRRGVEWSAAALLTMVTGVCCYPIWFALGQANLEVVIWVLLAGGIALFLRGRGYAAAVCFGLAASVKIYPVLFLVLLLMRKQYREVLTGVVVGGAFSIGALFFVGPTFSEAYRGIERGLNMFRELYMLRVRNESGLDHSLFGLVKLFLRRHSNFSVWMSDKLTIYLAVMTVFTVAVLVWRVRRMPVVNQIVFCTTVCVLFPPTSFEYTLLHIMTVFGLLMLVAVETARRGEAMPGLAIGLLLCAGIQAFLPELVYHLLQFEGAVKCLMLIALLVVSLRYEWKLPGSMWKAA